MRVFLGVHLPSLPLDVFRPRQPMPPESDSGCAVLEQGVVLRADAAARAAGVRVGMKRGGVLTVAPAVRLLERDPAREADALRAVALALLRFAPNVTLQDEATLLVEIGASLRLFGGLPALCRAARAALATLGYRARIGVAPTGGGAWLLARAGLRRPRRVLRRASLERALACVPCALLPAARPFAAWFDGLGCRTLADLRRLPRAALQRRCGTALSGALDRAYGDAPELFEWLPVPPVFDARLELPERVEHAEAVLFVARRLIAQLGGWLAARQLSLTAFECRLEHERGRHALPPTVLELAFAAPTRDEAHCVRVLGERLARVPLPAAVIAVRLVATRVVEAAPPPDDLFPEPGGTPEARARLFELLGARLGAHNVLRAAPVDDYRPEIANRWIPLGEPSGRAGEPAHAAPRPAWLLAEPLPLAERDNRPVYRTPLTLASARERIEAGWFDGAPRARDYYVAQDDAGACYWVYHGRTAHDGEPGWFLHGFFG
ncbi:DNA polymerase Y family protein [Burkholderia sp. FERM BP-3421]|uniref:Y-family DNA polymerase n=1 Tax=Burkholderia sp. FERM BP-3421 TaxID=1494466 RepID=UPI002361D6CF|nr:DNA polymerase Y family protein [Burkholderia sp. FERM BP-3421]WDD95399.1 DNA polymerase Y family protein [Burkholderia sp. FERM BP-3421]